MGLDLRPPSLEKVFAKSYRGYRLKHVIEPDIQYHLVRAHDPENILDIVRFDAMDIFTETNEMEYSLTNSILARKDVPDNSPDIPQARDIFSWRISQKYYFDPTFGGALVPGQNNVFASTIDLTGFAFEHGQRFSPIDSVFKFAPFSNYDTEIRTDVNPSGERRHSGCRHHFPRETRAAGVRLHRLLYQPFVLLGFAAGDHDHHDFTRPPR